MAVGITKFSFSMVLVVGCMNKHLFLLVIVGLSASVSSHFASNSISSQKNAKNTQFDKF